MNDFFLDLTGAQSYGQIMYPADNLNGVIFFNSVGLGVIYAPFKFIIQDDIWVFYCVTTTVLALNGLGCYLLMRALGVDIRIAAILGILFGCSNFVMSQLGNFVSFALFPSLFSLYFLLRSLKEQGRSKFLASISALFAVLQIYFSIYHFVFQLVLIIPFAIAGRIHRNRPVLIIWTSVLILLSIPFFIGHQNMISSLSGSNLMLMMADNERYSISLFFDYFRVHIGNLLYPAMGELQSEWMYHARSAFFGISTYILLVGALFHLLRHRSRMAVACFSVFAIAVIATSGPFFTIFGMEVLSPVGWVNKLVPKTMMIRHLFRLHHLVILTSLILIAFYLQSLLKDRPGRAMILTVVFASIFMFENIPFKAPLYESRKHITIPSGLVRVLDKIPPHQNLLFLPVCTSQITPEEFKDPIIPIAREYLYMNWKNSLDHNIYNGLISHTSDAGFIINQIFCELDQFGFDRFIYESDVNYFVVAKEYASDSFKEKDLPLLVANTVLIDQSDDFILLKVE
ncbi:MAG: hypothetical protein GY751_14480 [Bacteroidetes bacterium]|nr:hypothetical protein [Bacteroidota bacterium]